MKRRCTECGLSAPEDNELCLPCQAKKLEVPRPRQPGTTRPPAENQLLCTPAERPSCPEVKDGKQCTGTVRPVNVFRGSHYWRCSACGQKFHSKTGDPMPVEPMTPSELQNEFPTTRRSG